MGWFVLLTLFQKVTAEKPPQRIRYFQEIVYNCEHTGMVF